MTHIKLRDARSGGKVVQRRMLIPDEATVAAAIAAVPVGTAASLAAIRVGLAREFGAEATCPVTTWKMVQAIAEHGDDHVPYWRVVDPDKPNARRLLGGAELIAKRREEERAAHAG